MEYMKKYIKTVITITILTFLLGGNQKVHAADYLNVQGVYVPYMMEKGTNYSVVGTADSNQNITWIWMGVTNRGVNEHVIETEANPNSKSYDLKGIAGNLKFSTLAEKDYTFSVQGISNGTYYTSYIQDFSVKNKIKFDLNGGEIGSVRSTYKVTGFNRTRNAKELILYSVANSTINTNSYGAEIAVDANGKVIGKRNYGDDNKLKVPKDGFVLSGQLSDNEGGFLFTNAVKVGQYVYYNYQKGQVGSYDTQNDYLYVAKYVGSKEKYGTLPTPSRSGYVFDGWYTASTGGNKVTANTTYSSANLYAHWSKPKKENQITASSKIVPYQSKAFYLNVKTKGSCTLSYSSSNKNAAIVDKNGKVTPKGYGQTTITINAQETEEYKKATKKITVSVVPKQMKIKSVTSPKKKYIKMTWSKDNTATGYNLYISVNKNFKSKTYERWFKKNTLSMSTNGLKSKNTYYVKIRAYKTVRNKKFYGIWSSTKKVKIK